MNKAFKRLVDFMMLPSVFTRLFALIVCLALSVFGIVVILRGDMHPYAVAIPVTALNFTAVAMSTIVFVVKGR